MWVSNAVFPVSTRDGANFRAPTNHTTFQLEFDHQRPPASLRAQLAMQRHCKPPSVEYLEMFPPLSELDFFTDAQPPFSPLRSLPAPGTPSVFAEAAPVLTHTAAITPTLEESPSPAESQVPDSVTHVPQPDVPDSVTSDFVPASQPDVPDSVTSDVPAGQPDVKEDRRNTDIPKSSMCFPHVRLVCVFISGTPQYHRHNLTQCRT
jgi:hypothetical protein